MRLVKIKKDYINKQGEKKHTWQFYIELDNGNYVRVEPYVFRDVNGVIQASTYKEISLLAAEIKQ